MFPILAFSPETRLMLGGGLVFTFHSDGRADDHSKLRRSSIALATAYTFKRQFFVSVAPSVYWDSEAWHAAGEVSAIRFPNTFYPIANDTTEDEAEDYTEWGVTAAGRLTHRLAGSFRTGGQAGVYYRKITDEEAGGDLADDRVVGSDGGTAVGFGPVMLWDSRDNDFSTYSGGIYSLTATYFADVWGSDFNLSQYELDARQFFHLGGAHVIGAQIYGKANFGDVPFQLMGALGGAQRMRGFFEGRFRDLHMVTSQVEYRFPLVGRFSGAVFGSAGEVVGELDDWGTEHLRGAGGGGVRFALNQADRVKLRFDAAGTTTGDVNFYVALGEAF